MWGLLWMPVGCVICALIANRKGREVWQWVGRSALSSAFGLVPWFYAVATVSGLRVPRSAVVAAYVVLYSIWLVGPFASMLGQLVVLPIAMKDNAIWNHPVIAAIWSLFTAGNVLTWYFSQKSVRKAHREGRQAFAGVYHWPWALIILWSLAAKMMTLLWVILELSEVYTQGSG